MAGMQKLTPDFARFGNPLHPTKVQEADQATLSGKKRKQTYKPHTILRTKAIAEMWISGFTVSKKNMTRLLQRLTF